MKNCQEPNVVLRQLKVSRWHQGSEDIQCKVSFSIKNCNSLEDSQGTISKPKYNLKKHSCFI